MKILFVVDARSPIATNWIRHFVDRGGDEVSIASTFPCQLDFPVKRLEVTPVAFSSLKKPSQNPGSRSARSLGLRTVIRHWLGPLTIRRAAQRLREFIGEVKPDLVHAMRIPYEGMLAADAYTGIPLIVSIWGNDFILSFNWDPTVFNITDGQESTTALFKPQTYGASFEETTYTVDGIYKFAAEAEPHYKRSIAIFEKVYGLDHLDVAVNLYNRGGAYLELRRYAEAEPPLMRALEIRERALGPDHADVANVLNRLGNLNNLQKRYVEAEPLYKRAGAIWEKVFGPDHLDVAVSLFNLGNTYLGQKRYAEAEPVYKRALEIREKALGPDHLRVVSILNKLGDLLYPRLRYAEAEPFYKRALAIREKALGPDHPGARAC